MSSSSRSASSVCRSCSARPGLLRALEDPRRAYRRARHALLGRDLHSPSPRAPRAASPSCAAATGRTEEAIEERRAARAGAAYAVAGRLARRYALLVISAPESVNANEPATLKVGLAPPANGLHPAPWAGTAECASSPGHSCRHTDGGRSACSSRSRAPRVQMSRPWLHWREVSNGRGCFVRCWLRITGGKRGSGGRSVGARCDGRIILRDGRSARARSLPTAFLTDYVRREALDYDERPSCPLREITLSTASTRSATALSSRIPHLYSSEEYYTAAALGVCGTPVFGLSSRLIARGGTTAPPRPTWPDHRAWYRLPAAVSVDAARAPPPCPRARDVVAHSSSYLP